MLTQITKEILRDVSYWIGHYENVISDEQIKGVLDYPWTWSASTYSSHKGRTETSDERVRMDEVWIKDGNLYYNAVKAAFEYTIKKYSEKHPLFSVQHITDFRINRYPKDGFMSSHIDNIHHSHGKQYGYPQASIFLFLNDDYKGGEFVVADKGYYPAKGSGLIFPSNFMFPHEVKKVTNGVRWSVLAWTM